MDLSFPRGYSIIDGIEPSVCSLHYTSVDEACKRIVARGQGAILAKFDVEGAFRTVPVHPDDRQLLGIRWEGQIYVDKVLSFGLTSAPKLYNAVVDTLLWILERYDGVNGLHYMDDFLLFGAPNSSQCERALQAALARCRNLEYQWPLERLRVLALALVQLWPSSVWRIRLYVGLRSLYPGRPSPRDVSLYLAATRKYL